MESVIHLKGFSGSALALWVVGQEQRLTDCWWGSREKQEVGGQLKELKDQLEAEQYFTVILTINFSPFEHFD